MTTTSPPSTRPTRAHDPPPEATLARTVSLPLLVFYGLGVTVGAGIFALVGEILNVSGGLAPVAFGVSAAIAGTTAWTYSIFVREYPKAGGEAVYVGAGFGPRMGTVTGLLVVTAGTVSSAVVALAFGGYLEDAVGLPPRIGAIGVVAIVTALACRGVRDSVRVAAVMTVVEVGALVAVIMFGLPELLTTDLTETFTAPPGEGGLGVIASGAVLAFFAFIGFEDIANLAEETRDPQRNAPLAIAWTLGASLLLYILVSAIAVTIPDRAAITESDAPMARLFEAVSGHDGRIIAVIATFAMTNGILIQMIMASRVTFGLAREQMLPDSMGALGQVHESTRTPVVATAVVAAIVAALVLTAPLTDLARWTSVVILVIFTLVNAAFLRVSAGSTRRRTNRWVAGVGCVASAALACWELASVLT